MTLVRDQKSLKQSMILYPVIVSFLFLFPVLIGVWAHGSGLIINQGMEDMVLPMMVANYVPSFVYVFVMIGALSALMSTADSQLLSLSTMLTRDIPFKINRISQIFFGKILIVVLSLFAISYVIVGYNPNEGIMGTLVKTTFSGLAVLCPTTIAALYWKRVTKYGCIASIITGKFSILLYHFNIVPSFNFLPAIWATVIATFVLILVSYITKSKK